MNDYLQRKKKEKERRDIASQAGNGNANVNGQTLEEWRRNRNSFSAMAPEEDNEPKNIYGQSIAQYRKMKSEGGSLNKLDKWKGESEKLLDDYDRYSYSGEYQTTESHDEFSERIRKQLEQTVLLKGKYKENSSEIDEIVDRLSNAARDNDEGLSFFSQFDSDETYQQFLKYRQENEAKVKEDTDLKQQFEEINSKEISERKDLLRKKRINEASNNVLDAQNAEDFQEKSKYIVSEGDRDYEYINDEESGYKRKYGLGKNDVLSDQAKKGYNYITDDERKIYNYIYAAKGKNEAQNYLDTLNLTKRMTEAEVDRSKAYAEKHPVLSSAESVASNIMNAGDGLLGMAAQYITGEEIDPYNHRNLSTHQNNAIRGTVSENIGNGVGSFLYQTGMSMADFIGSSIATAPLAAIGISPQVAQGLILSSNAATQGILDAKEREISDGKAIFTGLLQGAAEMFFEKFSIEQLKMFSQTSPKTLKGVVKNVLKGMTTEGWEEGMTTITNTLTDWLVNKDLSSIGQSFDAYLQNGYTEEEAKKQAGIDLAKQIGLDALGGAISGGVISTGASGIGYAINHKNTETEQNQDKVIDTDLQTKMFEEEPKSVKLNEEQSQEESLEEEQIQQEEQRTQEEQSIEESEEIPWEEAEEYHPELVEQEVAPVQQNEETEAIEHQSTKEGNRKNIETVLQYGEVSDKLAVEIAKNNGMRTALEEKTGVKLRGTEEQQKNAVKEIVRTYAGIHGSTVSQTQKASVTAPAGQKATVRGRDTLIVGVKTENGSNPRFEAADGKSYLFEEVSFSNDKDRKLYSDAAKIAMTSDTETANSFIRNYDDSISIPYYSKGFDMFYSAARNGVTLETSLKKLDAFVEATNKEVMVNAWNLGNKARQRENSTVAVEKKQQERKGKGTYEDQTRKGGTIGEIQRLVANRTGIDITRSYQLDHDANGMFVPSTMRMLLSENAQNEYTALIHELGEFGLSYDRQGMKEVQDTLVKYWAEQNGIRGMEDLNEIVKEYQRRYTEVEENKTKTQAMDEIVNDALGGLFSTDTGVEEFIQWLQKDSGYNKTEQRTIIQRVIDIIDKVTEYLKAIIKDAKLSKAARQAAQLEEHNAKEVRQKFLKVLDTAIEKANTTGEYESDTAIKKSLKDFAEQYNKWDGKNPLKKFKVTITTDVYNFLGVAGKSVELDSSKIIKIKSKHKGMTDTVIKRIPEVLNQPALIMQSKNSDTRIVVTGELLDNQGKPVIIIMELEPKDRRGMLLDTIKIASAYGKDNMQDFIDKSEILYKNPDKKITDRWLKLTRLQLPVSNASKGYDHIITGMNENTSESTKFSLPEEYEELKREHEKVLRENDTFKRNIDYLEHLLGIQKGISISKKSAQKAADKLYRKYKSTADRTEFTERVTALFQDVAGKGGETKGNFLYLAEQIMRPVLEKSQNNQEISEYAQEILKDIKSKKIKVDLLQKKETAYRYGSYNDFRKKNFGRASFSDNGTALDTLWKEWSAIYPEIFDENISPVDQPIKLTEIIDSLKEDYVNEFGFDLNDAVSYAAMELMNEYINMPEVKALSDSKSSEEMRKNYWRLTNEIKKEYRDKYELQIKELKQANSRRLRDMSSLNREQLARQHAKFNERAAESRAQRIERQTKKKYKDRIVKNTKEIIKWFNDNTDKHHVPEILKSTALDFLETMDFLSESGWNTKTNMELQAKLNTLHRRFSTEMSNPEGSDFAGDIDPDFLPKLGGMIEELEKSKEAKKIVDMNSKELENVDYLVTTLKRAITTANKLIGNQRYEKVSELGNESITYLSGQKAKKNHGKLFSMSDEMLNMHMLDSKTFFDQMGEGASSIYREIREGFNKRVWKLDEAQKYMKKIIGDAKIRDWTGKKAETHSFDYNGQKFELTTGQLMNLYVLSKRPQAIKHLMAENGAISERGGFTIDKRSITGKQKVAERRIKVDELQLQQMFDKLTPEQKKMADAMQKFLAENCSEWGNEVSMTMYGYKKFGEKTYWPIKTNENFNETNDRTASNTGGTDNIFLYAIRNLGMTKNLVKNANNPIVVGDIFDVFSEHVTNMANYNAFVVPLSDAMKWFNYRSRTEQGAVNGSVKEEIERSYGNAAKRYFINFIKDVNGEVKRGTASEISNTFMSKYKAAAVGANVRVVVQQPTAYLRAAAVMNPKYLAEALTHKPAIKEMHENSAIAVWKSWGYFETGLGQSMKQVLTGEGTAIEKIVELGMWGAGKADDFTWGVLWNAVKAEIRDTHKDVDVTSPEFMEMIRNRFDEVIDRTQVVDTVLHRSQIMRDGDGLTKLAVAFMAEPTKSYNLLYKAVTKAVKQPSKANFTEVAKMATVYGVTGIATAAAASLMDAFRDDDEEKEWAEKYLKNFWENVSDNLNPIGMIPYLKEIPSILQGYDPSRMDMAGIASLVNSGRQVEKYIANDSKKTLYGVVKNIIRGISQTTGIPLYNALRDTEALVEQFTFAPIDEAEMTGKTVRIRLLKAMREENNKQLKKYLAWYDEKYQEKISSGKTDKEAKAALKSSITGQFKEIYQNSSADDKIKIKNLLLKISVGGQQLYKDYDWSSWEK